MAHVEPTNANAAVPPVDGRAGADFAVPITLPRRDATPEQHADALLASLGFDAADLARYREQTGVDLRQHFVNSFRNAPRQSHNHYANGRGGFTAYVPLDRAWHDELRRFAGGGTAAATNTNGAASPDDAFASRQGVDRAAQQRAVLNSNVPAGGGIPAGFTPEQRELILDLTQMGLDLAGIVDPTPVSDGTNGVISLFRGDLLGAGISVVGFIPYLGDLAKLGKVKKWAEVIGRVVDMARTDARFGEFVRFGMQKIKGLLDRIPLDKLPGPMREAVERLKAKVDEFFGRPAPPTGGTPPTPPRTEPPKIDKVRVGDVELPATTEMSVQDKLYRYLLDPDHPAGGPKAKWFREALGFTRENMDDLARQIVFDPARAAQTAVTPNGVKYNQVIGITGANGRQIDVTFAWIRNQDGVVRLVTSIPAKK
ncbi:MAG TPA: hypothetical protein VN228_00730 [Pyrinomonadaceae bacterium]|nr:hypothetical protein [Pyrinomonadaceae bacterium]